MLFSWCVPNITCAWFTRRDREIGLSRVDYWKIGSFNGSDRNDKSLGRKTTSPETIQLDLHFPTLWTLCPNNRRRRKISLSPWGHSFVYRGPDIEWKWRTRVKKETHSPSTHLVFHKTQSFSLSLSFQLMFPPKKYKPRPPTTALFCFYSFEVPLSRLLPRALF